MSPAIVAEFLGTALLLLMGNGVVANVVLNRTKGQGSGWIVITTGWGLAVFTAVLCVGAVSGAHINPAVTLSLALAGRFPWMEVPGYLVAQVLGGMAGAILVYYFYLDHYRVTDDPGAKLATFSTAPAIRNTGTNLMGEIVGTLVLTGAVLFMPESVFTVDGAEKAKVGLGALGALPVALIVFGIGLGLGGTTGYAINPARDLGPRIAHHILPIPGKGPSGWDYAWIPIVGPIIGGAIAAAFAILF